MKRLALILGISLMLLPAAAVAQTIDFQPDNILGNGEGGPGSGTWSWGGVGTDLTGNSGSYAAIEVTASTASFGGQDLVGSELYWDSGTSSAGGSGSLANFYGGTITITQDGGSYCSGPCFSGTLGSGSLVSIGSGIALEYNNATGTVDSNLLSYLGLPSASYQGAFSVTLDPNGTWQSADLNLAPVPEPGTLTLLGSGLLGLAGLVRRRLKK